MLSLFHVPYFRNPGFSEGVYNCWRWYIGHGRESSQELCQPTSLHLDPRWISQYIHSRNIAPMPKTRGIGNQWPWRRELRSLSFIAIYTSAQDIFDHAQWTSSRRTKTLDGSHWGDCSELNFDMQGQPLWNVAVVIFIQVHLCRHHQLSLMEFWSLWHRISLILSISILRAVPRLLNEVYGLLSRTTLKVLWDLG